MSTIGPLEQTDPPRSPQETLPTMYDLPSEDPKESGLPDELTLTTRVGTNDRTGLRSLVFPGYTRDKTCA